MIKNIPNSQIDPLIHYSNSVGWVERKFTFTQISMGELTKLLDKMKPTGSAAEDDVSMQVIKEARNKLQPLILLMINQSIKNRVYPDQLKTTKIVPIEKKGKTTTTSDGWRPVNVVPALSKILEWVLLKQIINHLEVNQLISHAHHRAVKGKSTQTVVIELYDRLMENLTKGDDSVLVLLDQSKAYKIVSHNIFL